MEVLGGWVGGPVFSDLLILAVRETVHKQGKQPRVCAC